jgi:hypothetical protein
VIRWADVSSGRPEQAHRTGTKTALGHPVLDQSDAALTDLLPEGSVDVRGEWSSRSRRSYVSEGQFGSGSGPFVDVVDHVWDGHFTGANALTGMAFLRTPTGVYWVKAAQATPTLTVRVSLHAYAGHRADRMTFFAGLGDVVLPSVVVGASADPSCGCLMAPNAIPAGRVVCLARTDETAFLVVLFQADSVKFGRNRLWRLRDVLASRLPEDVRGLMTRRRAGTFPIRA